MSKPLTRLLWSVALTVIVAGCVAIGNFMGVELDLSPFRAGDVTRPAPPCHLAPASQGPGVQDVEAHEEKGLRPQAAGTG